MGFFKDLFGGLSNSLNGPAQQSPTPTPPPATPTPAPKSNNTIYWVVGIIIVGGLLAWGIYAMTKKEKPKKD